MHLRQAFRKLVAVTVPAALVAVAVAIPPAASAARGDAVPGAAPLAAADELLVGFQRGASAQDRRRAATKVRAFDRDDVVRGRGRGAVDLFELRRGMDERTAIATLEADPAVAYAERNWRLTKLAVANDTYFADGRLWGMYGDGNPSYDGPQNAYGSQAAEAWAQGSTGSANVAVGVIDEGIMHTHPDLDGNVWTNPGDPSGGGDQDGNGYTDDTHGWDFFNDDSTVFDGNPPNDY